jgi:hypothetical protein
MCVLTVTEALSWGSITVLARLWLLHKPHDPGSVSRCNKWLASTDCLAVLVLLTPSMPYCVKASTRLAFLARVIAQVLPDRGI